MLAQISILGLYALNNTIFDKMVVPSDLDAETVRDAILQDAAEMNLIYPDADFMKLSIELWSKRRLHSWERMVTAIYEEYNPLWNKDGTITETRQRAGKASERGEVNDTSRSTDTNIHSVQGYNSSDWANAEKDTGNGSVTSATDSSRSRDESETETVTRTEGGNIGVTMSQDMLQAELDIRKTDIYHIIAEEFKERFCLMVY